MLRTAKLIETREGAYEFIMNHSDPDVVRKRKTAFNVVYPVDPELDIMPYDWQTEPDWFDRIERHVDEHGDRTVIAQLLSQLEGDYLMEERTNFHEVTWVITQI